METNMQSNIKMPAPAPVDEGLKKFTLLKAVSTLVVLTIILAVVLFLKPKPQEKVYHIGVLSGLSFFDASFDGFKEKMTELGYVEGKNVIYDRVQTDIPLPEVYTGLAQKLVADKNDLIFSYPTEASLVAKKVTDGKIPIVFSIGGTEGNDLVESIRHPGGNITGVHYPDVVDLSLLRLEILHKLMPKAKHIVMFSFPGYPIVPREDDALAKAAMNLGLDLTTVHINDMAKVKEEIGAWEKTQDMKKYQVILQTDGPTAVVADSVAAIGDLALKYNIPVGGMPIPDPQSGKYKVVYYILIDRKDAGRQAAVLADKILRGGVQAGTIPLPSADPYLDININETQKFNIEVTQDLLGRANHVTH